MNTRFAGLLVALAVTGTATAQNVEPLDLGRAMSSVRLDAISDSAGGNDIYLDADLALPAGLRWLLGSGTGRSGAADDGHYSGRIGLASDPNARLSFSVYAERWEQEGAVLFDTIGQNLTWTPGDWLIALDPDFRRIELPTQTTAFGGFIDIFGLGLGATLGYYGWNAWGASLSYYAASYTRDIGALDQYPVLAQRLFSDTTLGLTRGLNRAQLRAEVSRYGRRYSFALAGGQTIAEADGAILYSVSTRLDYDLGRAWRLGVNGGASFAAGLDTTSYGGVSLRFQW